MNYLPNFSYVAKLISDSSRAIILHSLMEVDGLPASALAQKAGISLQTASGHLYKLVEGNLLTVERHGRHKYYRLANYEIAQIIESLSFIAPPIKVTSLNNYSATEKLKHARTCYDHLAGRLGVAITDALIHKGYLTDDIEELNFTMTASGVEFFESLGIDVQQLQKKRRQFARKCLDWSERRYHLAGALGNAVMLIMLQENWIEKLPKRAVKVTDVGAKRLREKLGISLD